MTVFKGYMLVMRQNIGYFFMYFGIFVGLTLGISSVVGKEESSLFASTRLNIAVVDEDGGILAKGIEEMLSAKHEVRIAALNRSDLAEEMYYGMLDYVVCIPENADELLLSGEEALEVTKVPGSYNGYFVDNQLNDFLNTVKLYLTADYGLEEAVERAVRLVTEEQAEVSLASRSGYASDRSPFSWYYRYLPYFYLASFCYCISFILMKFGSSSIRRRMGCSCVPPQKQGIQAAAALSLIGFAGWLISVLIPMGLYGKSFFADSNAPLYLLNAFCLMLVALCIAFFIGNLVKSDLAVNGLANVVSLGMCFLCGVYVDLELLGSGVKAVSRFLPVYWYETTNELLARHAELTGEMRREIVWGMGIQLLTAAACLCLALAVKRKRANEGME